MAANSKKIYKNRNPISVVITVILSALAILLVLALLMFFGFRKYIVYTPDGLHLEVPWLGYGISEESVSPSPDITATPQ